MTYYAFANGFVIAFIVVMVFLAIRLWAKTSLERWGYDLTRETHIQLRDTTLKLDSIHRQQERVHSRLDRLEQAVTSQTDELKDLCSRLAPPKTGARRPRTKRAIPASS